MIRVLLLFIALLNAQVFFGQKINANFYYVNDPDGWVNVRNNNKEIIDRLSNNTLVYTYPADDKGEWIPVEYNARSRKAQGKGLIHKSRLQSVNTLNKIPATSKNDNSYTFSNKDINIKIEKEAFDLKGRTLKYSEQGTWIESIDGKHVWGANGTLPKTQLKSIEIFKDGKRIVVDKAALENLFEPNLAYIDIYYNRGSNLLYITSTNGSGSHRYIATWTIQND